jgi:hypothetical protein
MVTVGLKRRAQRCERRGASAVRHHVAGGGSGARCRARSSEGRGSTLVVVDPNGSGRQSGRQGRARGGACLVWRTPMGRPRKKGEHAREKEKKWAQPQMNSANFNLIQIFKLI